MHNIKYHNYSTAVKTKGRSILNTTFYPAAIKRFTVYLNRCFFILEYEIVDILRSYNLTGSRKHFFVCVGSVY